jgi:hypothetical protein
MQKYNRATNWNKAACLIRGVHISTVFDKILDNRQVILPGSPMHGRPAKLQQQYHHPTHNKQQQQQQLQLGGDAHTEMSNRRALNTKQQKRIPMSNTCKRLEKVVRTTTGAATRYVQFTLSLQFTFTPLVIVCFTESRFPPFAAFSNCLSAFLSAWLISLRLTTEFCYEPKKRIRK